MAHSTKPDSVGKRAAKFPLTLHKPTGQYRKRIRGRDFYFGTNPDAALAKWLREKDDLLAGRTPKPFDDDKCDLRALCNHFLTNAKSKRDGGELTSRSFDDYYKSCDRLLKHLGKTTVVEEIRPDDLMRLRRVLAKTLNPASLGNEVGRVRVILRFGFENGLTDKPVRFGDFKRPAKRVLRRQRAKNGEKMFEAATIRKLLDSADVQLKAMILLAVNCGFGNADCGQLPVAALDLKAGWVDFPRPKTGIGRRCPLWSETIDALKVVINFRKNADDDLVFRTKYGGPWFVDANRNPLSAEFRKLCQAVGVYEAGRGFYALRHVFQTIGDETIDSLAVKQIMGHVDSSISATYRERFADSRLLAVTNHVHDWLFDNEDAAILPLRKATVAV